MVTIKSDSDDIFHEVTMSEEVSWQEGYNAGLQEGKKKGFFEGFELGALKGSELGAEIGFYTGLAETILEKYCSTSDSRITKVCETILNLAQNFVDIDPTSENLSTCLSTLQGKFRQLTSLLGIHIDHHTVSRKTEQGFTF